MRPPVRMVLALAIGAWLLALLYSALSGRVMYADGAYYVMVHLQSFHRFDDYDLNRSFASYISQAPILLGQKLGFDRVATFAALYSVGAIAIPALAMMAALVLSRRQPWLFALVGCACIVFGFGLNYINSEANLLFGLVLLCMAILGLDHPAPFLRGFVLPLLAVAMLRIYEGMLLAGPVLCLWALAAAPRVNDERSRVGLTVSAVLFAIGTAIGFGGWLAPRDPANAQGFAASALRFVQNPQLWLLVAAVAVIPAIVLPSRRIMVACAAASAAAGAAFLWALDDITGYFGYAIYYDNRAFLAMSLPVFAAVGLVAWWRRPRWAEGAMTHGYGVVLVPLLFAVAGDMMGTRQWNRYMSEFCTVLNQPDMKPAERLESLKATGVVTGWSWTHPTMSVLLRHRGSDAIVANQPGQRFEPDVQGAARAGYRGFCEAPFLGAIGRRP